MFGIEFSEFLIIGIVALIVLGPERLPKVARTAGHLFGRLQRYAADVKQQVKREMEAEDIKNLQSQFQEVKDAASGVENSIRNEAAQTETQLMSAIDAPPPSSLEFVEHAEVPPPPEPPTPATLATPGPTTSPQLELPLAGTEPTPAATSEPTKPK